MKDYVKGIIGGLIGGLIATIPWVLIYLYMDMLFSILAVIIGVGVLRGYQTFKGKVDNKLPIIITTISLVCITFATFIVIPAGLLLQEGIDVNMETMPALYEYGEFTSAIMRDYIISVFFTILGISGVIQSIKKQLSENKDKIEIDLKNNYVNNQVYSDESMKEIKERFIKFGAMDKYNAVTREQVFEKGFDFGLQQAFNTLKVQQIIKKYHKKYYYSEEYEKSTFKRFITLFGKIMLWVILITIIFVVLIVSFT